MEANKNDSESNELGPYFRIGVSRDYILIRNDFPVGSMSPGAFKELTLRMFAANEKIFDEK